jgi:hypothetical protein
MAALYFIVVKMYVKTNISHMKQQFVLTYTIRQTQIPALLDHWVTNTPSVNILYT